MSRMFTVVSLSTDPISRILGLPSSVVALKPRTVLTVDLLMSTWTLASLILIMECRVAVFGFISISVPTSLVITSFICLSSYEPTGISIERKELPLSIEYTNVLLSARISGML